MTRSFAYIVEVDVDAAIVQHQEVPQGINPLDGVSVAVVGAEDPGVFLFDKVAGLLLGPYLEVRVSADRLP
jgi:hypothetical protein